MITICVFRRTGNSPATGKKVTVITPTGTKSNFTDSRGRADFELPSGKYKISIDGRIVYDGSCVGATTVYI